MAEFSFVFNRHLREILERDYAELQQLNTRTSTKAVIVLSGGIIEGLLFDALVASGKWSFEEACQNFLKDMIGPAKNRGIITEDRLTDVTRKYRNLIHPGREIKESLVFEENDAVLAKTAASILIREVRSWATAEQRQRYLRKFLSELDTDQRDFLQLFANLEFEENRFEHPLLSSNVYRSRESLIANGVLIKELNEDLGKNRERVTLVREAVMLVEELVVKGKVQRESITLDLGHVAASSAGGSGAPPITQVSGGIQRPAKSGEVPLSSVFPAVFEVSKNQAVVEESTQVVVALNEISLSRKALFTVTLPGKEPQQFPDMLAGHVWRFEREGSKYRMTLLEVSYIKDRAKLEVRRDPDF